MKKRFYLSLLLGLMLLFVAYGKQTPQHKNTFKNDTLKIEDTAVIQLKESQVFSRFNAKGDEIKLLVIEYDYTNKSDQPEYAETVFVSYFTAIQDENEDTGVYDYLLTGYEPLDERYLPLKEHAQSKVKPGETISTYISYTLNDFDYPEVTLIANEGVDDPDELGRKVYDVVSQVIEE